MEAALFQGRGRGLGERGPSQRYVGDGRTAPAGAFGLHAIHGAVRERSSPCGGGREGSTRIDSSFSWRSATSASRLGRVERGARGHPGPVWHRGRGRQPRHRQASGATMTTDSFTVVANQGYVTAHNSADCPALRHASNRTQHANFDALAVALVMSDGRPRPCGHCWPATMKTAGLRRWVANLALAAGRALAARETAQSGECGSHSDR